jgi:hypothetical protein
MAKGKKPRRVFSKDELLRFNPVRRATRHLPIARGDQTDILIMAYDALDAIRGGRAGPDDPQALATAANCSMVLCELGVGAEYLEDAIAAQDAILKAQARQNQGHNFNFTHAEKERVVTLLDLFSQQVQLTTLDQLARAVTIMNERREAGQARTA